MAFSLISVFVTYDITISTYLTHANVSSFFSAHWAGNWHWIASWLINVYLWNTSCIVKVNHEHLESYSGQLCSTGCVHDKNNRINHVITNRQLVMISAESIPPHQFLEWSFCSHFESVLCVAAACFFLFDICIEGEWRTGVGFPQHISGWLWKCACHTLFKTRQSRQIMVSYLLPSISLISIVLSDSSRHRHVLLSAGCHSFSWLNCNPLKCGRTELTKIRLVMWCAFQ